MAQTYTSPSSALGSTSGINNDPNFRRLTNRVSEAYILDYRNGHRETYQAWKQRTRTADALLRGDWRVIFKDEMARTELPNVTNLAESFARDLSRLVTETIPTSSVTAKDESEPAEVKAHIEEAIADTYWEVNRGNLLLPLLTLDLISSGTCFMVCWTDDESPYPRFQRVDPRMAYPDVYNGQVQDLMVISTLKARMAERLFPELNLADNKIMKFAADEVEIVDYYSRDECVKALISMKRGGGTGGSDVAPLGEEGVFIIKRWQPQTEHPPVAMAQLPSHDGAFRGMLDQVIGSLQAKNKAVRLILDYMEHIVTAPFVGKGVLNPQDVPGPNTFYQLDTSMPDARLERLAPSAGAPNLLNILEYLDREQRGQLGYPTSRQGDVTQNIASASFVASTQGQLSSVVKEVQRLLGDVRSQITGSMFELDRKFKDARKPLSRPVHKKKTYLPKSDIDESVYLDVVYGVGAGLDRLNADSRLIQHSQVGFISKETARDNLEYLKDSLSETDKIERERMRDIYFQRLAADPTLPLPVMAAMIASMEKQGLSAMEAAVAVAPLLSQMAQQGAQGAPGTTESAGPQVQTAEQIQKGAVPSGPPEQGATPTAGAPAQENQFSPAPGSLAQVVISQPR